MENLAKLNVCSSVSGYVNLQGVSLWAILSFGFICVKFWLEFLANELWSKHSSHIILVEAIKPGDNSNVQAYQLWGELKVETHLLWHFVHCNNSVPVPKPQNINNSKQHANKLAVHSDAPLAPNQRQNQILTLECH